MTKLTKKVALEIAISAISANAVKEYHFAGSEDTFSADDAIAKIKTMMEQLDAKANAPKKPTKTQQENEGTKELVLEVLANVAKPVTISELMQADETLGALSNQKVAALVRQLVKDNKVKRSEEGRKAYFGLME